jgi:uncharacterized protein YuzE
MRVRYDKLADAAYIYLTPQKPGSAVRTYACDPEAVKGHVHLDFDKDGHLIGIEVLNASRLLPETALVNSDQDGGA